MLDSLLLEVLRVLFVCTLCGQNIKMLQAAAGCDEIMVIVYQKA